DIDTVIADIQAVCRRRGWPTNVRPKIQAYLDARGHFYLKQIMRLGGWTKVCALGGMGDPTNLTEPPDIDTVIADIQAICRRCGWPTNVRPTFQAYLDARGHFYSKQIKRLGGWIKVCARGGM